MAIAAKPDAVGWVDDAWFYRLGCSLLARMNV
jgi:hypothetical protein